MDQNGSTRFDAHRAAIVAAARGWIGTPYHHLASMKGVGCDCIGLVRGVWRDLYGSEAAAVPSYSRDWGEAAETDTLIEAGNRHLVRTDITAMKSGDVFALRWRGVRSPKHVGILTTPARFIHAYEKSGVIEVTLSRQWRDMIVAAWMFPAPQEAGKE